MSATIALCGVAAVLALPTNPLASIAALLVALGLSITSRVCGERGLV